MRTVRRFILYWNMIVKTETQNNIFFFFPKERKQAIPLPKKDFFF